LTAALTGDITAHSAQQLPYHRLHCCNDDQENQWENGKFDPPPVDIKPLKMLKPKLD